ncbi:lipopolysaccharide biosynthesis protein [Sphingomonas sp. PAMC 26617]|uniref:lipopolysaccharide biosynthesis protein n=1 Tax=Sphingomonas sp. PAMC 26617 TaxID=1112216 RepID=UPI0002889A13|nr:lipopolysaccharide biosynthesis protein [Sphingomonas sp. PAMC 26617]
MTERPQDLAGRTLSGAAWLIASKLGTRSIDFVGLLLLANLLLPADFGMVAVALTLVQIVEAIFEIPITQVLVRSDAITPDLLDTAFTIGLIRGGVLTLILAALAWPFALLYHEPRLVPLICFLSIAPTVRGLMSPAMAHYARAIDFRRDLLIEVIGKIVALGCAVPLAIMTRSYWALATATVAAPVATMALTYWFAPYRPRWSLARWSVFSHFVGWMTASQTIGALNWQIDRLMLARFVGKAELGSFSLAGDLAAIPDQAMIKPITRPLLGAFAALQGDAQRLSRAYARSVGMMLTTGLPIVLGLSLLAEPVVRLALGPKWQACWPMLQWLALPLIPALITAPLVSLAMTTGRTEITLHRNVVELVLKIPLVFVGAYYYGTYGLIAGRVISAVLMLAVCSWLVRRLIGLSIVDQLLGTWRPLGAGMVMVLTLFALRPVLHDLRGIPLAIGLAACGGTALACYLATLFALWRAHDRPPGIETMIVDRISQLRRRFGPFAGSRPAH